MKKWIIYLLSPVVLAGCAQSSGVMKMGPETYSVSMHAAPARGGIQGAQRLAMEEATSHCQSLEQELLVTNVSTGPSSHFPGGTAEVTFYCLDDADPALQRPEYRTRPDILIESR